MPQPTGQATVQATAQATAQAPAQATGQATVQVSDAPSVTLNGFKLGVPEARAHASSSQYATLSNGAPFSCELTNTSERDADCDLYVDGVLLGHYRVGGGKTVRVQRPTALAQQLTFDEAGSLRRFDKHLPLDPSQLSLVKAVFKAACCNARNSTMVPPALAPACEARGAPSLLPTTEPHPFAVESSAAASSQRFAFVPPLDDTDPSEATTLFVRLVSASGPVLNALPVSGSVPVIAPSVPLMAELRPQPTTNASTWK